MSERNGAGGVLWFLAGLGIGAAVGILYAPQSGSETREILMSKAEEGRDFVAQRAAGKPGSARLFLRGNGKPWGKSEQQRPLSAACTAARIDPPVNFHGLRHTCATLLPLNNVNVKAVSERLGHASIEITHNTYSHVLRSARAAFAGRGGNAVRPQADGRALGRPLLVDPSLPALRRASAPRAGGLPRRAA